MRKRAILFASALTFVGVCHHCTAQESPDLIEQDLLRMADSLSSLAGELTPFMYMEPGVEGGLPNQFGAYQLRDSFNAAHSAVLNTRYFAFISPARRATEIAICEGLAYNIGTIRMIEWSIRADMKWVTDSTLIHIGMRTRTILISLVERLRSVDWGPCDPAVEERLQLAESMIGATETWIDSAGLAPVNPR